MSRHILVIGDSMSLAHVARAMVAARRLQNEGHRISFATGPAYQELARREGFEPHELYAVPPEHAIAAIRKGSHIFDMETLGRYVESDLSLLERVQPDCILADFRLSLNISAELAGVEYWNIINGYMTHFYAAPQSPPETFPVVRLLGNRISSSLFPLLKGMTLRYYAINFNRYRKRNGLKKIRDIFDVIASPHGNLIADLPELIPCENLPSQFHYVGPLIWEPDIPDPDWLGQIRSDLPTVYVTMGSTGGIEDYQKVLLTLRDAGYQVLTTAGSHFEDVPDGIYSVAYARGSVLLKRSNAVVCHGGSLTIYQAVREGVPVVGAPTFHDQEINMKRVEEIKWGVTLRPGRWEKEDLVEAVERVQGEEYRNRVLHGQERLVTAIRDSESRPLIPFA